MVLNSVSNTAMEKALSGLWQRQQSINQNLANEDTPGYKAKRVNFESALKRELDNVKNLHLSRRQSISNINSVVPEKYELGGLESRADGNNVDIDSEYIELARTQIHYNALEQRISGYYTNLKYVISGGR